MANPLDNTLILIGEGETFGEELCRMIEGAQMFDDFMRAEIKIVSKYSRAYEVEKGVSVFKEGQKGSFMCLLIDGRIDIFKQCDERESKKITTIRPGKTMGEMSLLDDLPHSATTIATEKSTLVLITKNNFDRLLEEHKITSAKYDHALKEGKRFNIIKKHMVSQLKGK